MIKQKSKQKNWVLSRKLQRTEALSRSHPRASGARDDGAALASRSSRSRTAPRGAQRCWPEECFGRPGGCGHVCALVGDAAAAAAAGARIARRATPLHTHRQVQRQRRGAPAAATSRPIVGRPLLRSAASACSDGVDGSWLLRRLKKRRSEHVGAPAAAATSKVAACEVRRPQWG